ncbi:MAG: YedE-related selenium metabolism membrane protein [Pirellulales bacterium]|nr:YedE-related selenium metabolism membrane protein [Pirellulales bacterium]
MNLTRFLGSRKGMMAAGAAIGTMAALLQYWGNPPNMGLCMVCFPRDMAGAIGLHRAAVVQYLRPEIMGVVFGALVAALAAKEWRPRAGSAPLVRFLLGVFAVIGALAFLGCPWRAMLRLAAGDWNSLTGIAGLALGVGIGCVFLKRGYSLGRSYPTAKIAGWLFPAVMGLLLGLLLLKTSFQEGQAIFFSESGPGAMHAPVWLSLVLGVAIGVLAQRTRFCTMGSLRDAMLIRDFHLLSGVIALVIAAFVVNLCTGSVKPGWAAMPISHSNHLWNFLGMLLAGLCFALAGGCPGRQFFLSGEGDGDAAVFCCGMVVGAGITHNWFLAGVPDRMVDDVLRVGGPGHYGQVAVIVGVVFCVILGLTARPQKA